MPSELMKQYAEKEPTALRQDISELKRELMNLRFQKASGELSNTARFKEVRANIARAYTVLNQQGNAKGANNA